MHEHYAASVDGLVDEAARSGHVDEQVGIVDVLDADAKVADARGRVVGGDGLGAHGDYVRDTPVSERPGRDGSVDPAKARRGVLLEKGAVKSCSATDLRAQVELPVYDGVYVPPDHAWLEPRPIALWA